MLPAQTNPRTANSRKASSGQTVFDSHLICMECGLHMKMLKRHLQTVHNMTPAEYREKWHLTGDYPMVAQQYAALRSSLAKEADWANGRCRAAGKPAIKAANRIRRIEQQHPNRPEFG